MYLNVGRQGMEVKSFCNGKEMAKNDEWIGR
jgi:hypothetical protein